MLKTITRICLAALAVGVMTLVIYVAKILRIWHNEYMDRPDRLWPEYAAYAALAVTVLCAVLCVAQAVRKQSPKSAAIALGGSVAAFGTFFLIVAAA